MRLSCVFALGLAVVGMGVGRAAALDVQHPVHHSKTASKHLAVQAHPQHVHSSTSVATHRIHTTAATSASLHHAVLTRGHHHHYYGERFTASSFAKGDIFADDVTAGEDPVVRQAAIDALGDMNGTAVVIDPSNGRILAMVNQKLALSPGAEPCSTIKLSVALAALSEGLVTRDTPVQLAGFRMNMTDAIAKSNNLYFEELGRELGFERVRHYATPVRPGRTGRIPHRRRAAWRIPHRSLPGVGRRRGPHVQLRAGRLDDAAATRRLRRFARQRRNALLSAAPDVDRKKLPRSSPR